MRWLLPLYALILVSCGQQDEPAPSRPQEAPAIQQAKDLAERERIARLEAITAPTRAEQERQSAIADELAKLRKEAEARAVEQQREIDGRAKAAQRDADDRAARLQAAADRRWAILAAAAACAASVGAAVVLGYLGMRTLAIVVPIAVCSAAGIGVGVLSAGPLLGWILGGMVVLAIVAGAIVGIRAIRTERDDHAAALKQAVKYGETVTEEIAGHLPASIEVIKDKAKAEAVQAGGKAAAILTQTIRRVRSEIDQHKATG